MGGSPGTRDARRGFVSGEGRRGRGSWRGFREWREQEREMVLAEENVGAGEGLAGDRVEEGFGEEQCDGGEGEISPEVELVEESGRGARGRMGKDELGRRMTGGRRWSWRRWQRGGPVAAAAAAAAAQGRWRQWHKGGGGSSTRAAAVVAWGWRRWRRQ